MGKMWKFVVQNDEKTMSAVVTLYASDLDDAEEWVIDFCRAGLIIRPMQETSTVRHLNNPQNKIV